MPTAAPALPRVVSGVPVLPVAPAKPLDRRLLALAGASLLLVAAGGAVVLLAGRRQLRGLMS
jgi:hypothetical protein